jgi:hypothetical protein
LTTEAIDVCLQARLQIIVGCGSIQVLNC